jgi:2'-hydroxyisoflavone reductase
MRILVVGGTSFVGRAIVWSAWHHGHQVTVVNRGVTPSDLPEAVERLVGDRRADLSALAGRDFDATVDAIAYRPSDVVRLAAALSGRGGHYVQISSVSAYADPSTDGATEATLTLWDEDGLDLEGPITDETYGPLKAAAERAGLAHFGESSCFVRPTYVIGSHDATLRFPYWVERARRGGEIAVPGPATNSLQYVDARDLANFVVRVVEDGLSGGYHAAGPAGGEPFLDVIERVAAHVAPAGTTLRVVAADEVTAAGLAARFPLWSGPRSERVLALDSDRAESRGLDLRPLEDSVDDVLEWWGERPWPEGWLGADDETRLLARARAAG